LDPSELKSAEDEAREYLKGVIKRWKAKKWDFAAFLMDVFVDHEGLGTNSPPRDYSKYSSHISSDPKYEQAFTRYVVQTAIAQGGEKAKANPNQWITVPINKDATKGSRTAFDVSWHRWPDNGVIPGEESGQELWYALGAGHFGVVGKARVKFVKEEWNGASGHRMHFCNWKVDYDGVAIQQDVFDFPPGFMNYRLAYPPATAYRAGNFLERVMDYPVVFHREQWTERHTWTVVVIDDDGNETSNVAGESENSGYRY
jgi:hypothetical protein